MNCRNVRHWLFESRCGEALPKALRKHLAACARCRRVRHRLARLEEQCQGEAAPVSEPGLQAFLDRLATLPAPAPATLPLPLPRRWKPRLVWAASILVFVGLIGLLLSFGGNPDAPVPDHGLTVAPTRTEDQLVARFVQRDLVLADTTTPAKQWRVLADMADDLRGEAMRLAELNAPDDVPMVARLYERVLRRGLIGRADALPAQERKELLQELARDLRGQNVKLNETLRQKPADWTTLLQPIQTATRQTADALAIDAIPAPQAADGPAAIPGGSDYRRLLLTALVMNGLRLAEETDPLKRADCCSDVADHILQAIVTASVKGDRENVSALGKHLGDFVERGVSVNLARVPVDDPRVRELRQVMLRANQILLALDKTVEQMTTKGQNDKSGAAPLDQLKDLEKMLKDVEKSLKKVHKAFKEGEKGKSKGKDKGKSSSSLPRLWRHDAKAYCYLSAWDHSFQRPTLLASRRAAIM